jgi:hypothetical protein
MNDDQDWTWLGHGPHNLAKLRHVAMNAMPKVGSKDHCAKSSNAPVPGIATREIVINRTAVVSDSNERSTLTT